MIYPALNEVLKSVLGALIFGVLSGLLCCTVDAALACVHRVVAIPRAFYEAITVKGGASRILKVKYAGRESGSACERFFRDFLVFFICGVAFQILLYVCADGVFRFYLLAISVASAYIFVRYPGKVLKDFIVVVINFALNFTVASMVILCRPFFVIIRVILTYFKRHNALDKQANT